MKRLHRDKANHEVLEGFLESLLGKKYTIVRFLESEGNRPSRNGDIRLVTGAAHTDTQRPGADR